MLRILQRFHAQYIRSVTVYDQFTTQGRFDALWLSEEVRSAYTDAYASRHALDDEKKQVFLRRQLEENDHFIFFYVLSNGSVNLTDQQSEWSIVLRVAGHVFKPIEIKEAELSPEYRAFFGKKLTRFKVIYGIKFDAQDAEDMPLIQEHVDKIELAI